MRMIYRYPQAAFPYDELLARNRARSRHEPRVRTLGYRMRSEAGFFEIEIEYAKASRDDILIRVDATNHSPTASTAPHSADDLVSKYLELGP